MVVEKLTEISNISAEQAGARKSGNLELAIELDRRLDLLYGEKERAVGSWDKHVREHEC